MKLLDTLNNMMPLDNPTDEEILNIVKKGYHVAVAHKNNYDDVLVDYVLFLSDNVIYVAKTSDSTKDNIVLTPEMAFNLTKDSVFYDLLSNYLASEDDFFVDTKGLMKNAELRLGCNDLNSINDCLEQNSIFIFRDPYSPLDNLDIPEKQISIINHEEELFYDSTLLQDLIKNLHGVKVIEKQDEADIVIKILPSHETCSSEKIFFCSDTDVNKKTIFFSSRNAILHQIKPTNFITLAVKHLDDAIKTCEGR